MTAIRLVVVLALLALGQGPGPFQPPMPEPGNPRHEKPPKDVFCTPDGDAGHACACHPTCMDGRDQDGNPDGTTIRQEDNVRCRAACHPASCKCRSECEP